MLKVFLERIFLISAGESLCDYCVLGFLQNLLLQMCFHAPVMRGNVCGAMYLFLDCFSSNMFWDDIGWIIIMIFLKIYIVEGFIA